MKKFLLLGAAIITGFFAKSQSSLAIAIDTVPYPAAVHNYTINTDTSNHNVPTEMLEFKITNVSGSTKQVAIKKTVVSNTAGQDLYFCFNQTCYGTGTINSSVASMAAGSSLPNGNNSYGLRTEFDCWGIIGTSVVRYTIYDTQNSADSMNITITYNVTDVNAIKNVNRTVFVSNATPNPAVNVVNFNYDLNGNANASVKIFNSLGALVKTTALNAFSKSTQVDVSGLEEGLYFYSIVSGDKIVSTRRLVIAR